MGIRCASTTKKGQPCRAWSIRDRQPPACSAHAGRNTGAGAPAGNQNRVTHGFYAGDFTERELADLVSLAGAIDLIDEMAVARIHLRRLTSFLSKRFEDIPAGNLASISPLITTSLNTIANLIRTHHLVTGGSASDIGAAINQALDELGELWEVEL